MSYSYRERDRFEEDRPVTIKRYVIGSDDREERREFMSREDSLGDRELVIRRKTEREEPLSISRYERDVEYDPPVRRFEREYEREYYEPRNAYTSPRESEYDVVRRSDAEDDPYYYHHHRRVREYEDRRSRRELSPGDSISQTSRRRDRDRDDYSSDDSMVYIRKETRDYDGEHHHHKRHLAEGALVGVGAAELLRSRSKREGKEVSHGLSHAVKTAGAGALGAVAVNAAGHVRDYYRSKSRSRHRSHSFDDDRSYRHSRSHRSRSRSHSHTRGKTLLEIGVGVAALAAGAAALHNKSKNDRRSRSRTRSRSRSRARALSSTRSEKDKDGASEETKRRQHMAGAGLAGAAVAGLVEHARSRSRSRKGERSHSRLRKALPILGAGLATAAATGLYEKKKADKEQKELAPHEGRRSRSRSRSRAPSDAYPDPTRDSAGLIEYGADPVAGSIPAEHYYGQPAGQGDPYYSDGARRHSRSRSRGGRYSGSSDSDRDGRRKSRKHRSRSRDLASAALGATGLGYAAHKYSQHRDRKNAERSRSRSRTRESVTDPPLERNLTCTNDSIAGYEDDAHRDPYEESYDPEPYPVSSQPAHQRPAENYYPNSNYFPPPPGSTPNLNTTPQPYNPADYPPPPGAAPPAQPYNYGSANTGPETYAPRPRRADENVSAPSSSTLPTEQTHAHDGLNNNSHPQFPSSIPREDNSSGSPSKSVAFDLTPDSARSADPGYETDDSDSTVDGNTPRHRSKSQSRTHRRSSSVPTAHSHHHRNSDGTGSGPNSSSSPSRHHHSSHRHSHHSQRSSPREDSPLDSDSTVDLPDRFDSKGRLLPQKDSSVEQLEDYLRKIARVLI
ncbi:hypothetical protein F1880_008574 [Penicillium rolfsii]|nr:hypothetical protein F1880_008574 [Penicillium rolfsii]